MCWIVRGGIPIYIIERCIVSTLAWCDHHLESILRYLSVLHFKIFPCILTGLLSVPIFDWFFLTMVLDSRVNPLEINIKYLITCSPASANFLACYYSSLIVSRDSSGFFYFVIFTIFFPKSVLSIDPYMWYRWFIISHAMTLI